MNMRRAARTALVAPLMIGGAAVVLAFGTGTVFAASWPPMQAQPSTRPERRQARTNTRMLSAPTRPSFGWDMHGHLHRYQDLG